MAEALTATISTALLDYQMSGRPEGAGWATWTRPTSPHDLYRCAGDDEWVAIAVTSTE